MLAPDDGRLYRTFGRQRTADYPRHCQPDAGSIRRYECDVATSAARLTTRAPGRASHDYWHTAWMPTSSAKPKLVPCHFTFEDLQLLEWSCREKAQRARSDAKRETTPSSIETFTSTAMKYEALAGRIQRLTEIGAR